MPPFNDSHGTCWPTPEARCLPWLSRRKPVFHLPRNYGLCRSEKSAKIARASKVQGQPLQCRHFASFQRKHLRSPATDFCCWSMHSSHNHSSLFIGPSASTHGTACSAPYPPDHNLSLPWHISHSPSSPASEFQGSWAIRSARHPDPRGRT